MNRHVESDVEDAFNEEDDNVSVTSSVVGNEEEFRSSNNIDNKGKEA